MLINSASSTASRFSTASNAAPTVAITSPANNSASTAPASFTITADAADSDGSIARVEFYQGSTKLGEDTTAPYEQGVSGLLVGSYAFSAIAVDNSGAATLSSIINVTVNASSPPTVSITAPVNNASFDAPATISITADAADTDGTVSKVEFFNGATKLGEDTTAPILIALKDGFILTVVHSEPSFLIQLRNGTGDILTTNETRFFISIMSLVESAYSRALTTVRKEVHRARVKINNITNREIERFVGLEGVVNDFTAALVPTSTALQSVLSGKWLRLGEEDSEAVEDLVIATQQTVESAKSVGRTITNIRSAYSIILSNKLNTIVEVLTGMTVVLTIPMVVASLYGMNVPLPFQESRATFTFIIVFIVVCMLLMWYAIKRDKLF